MSRMTTKFLTRPTVDITWESNGEHNSSYPMRSTVEIPSFVMEDYRGDDDAIVITDYIRNLHGFHQFEWEWINEVEQCQ